MKIVFISGALVLSLLCLIPIVCSIFSNKKIQDPSNKKEYNGIKVTYH
jgi:cbb3-type cytochrome oxidase cytochrome c subunit